MGLALCRKHQEALMDADERRGQTHRVGLRAGQMVKAQAKLEMAAEGHQEALREAGVVEEQAWAAETMMKQELGASEARLEAVHQLVL